MAVRARQALGPLVVGFLVTAGFLAYAGNKVAKGGIGRDSLRGGWASQLANGMGTASSPGRRLSASQFEVFAFIDNEQCPNGYDEVGESSCLAAAQAALPSGTVQGRTELQSVTSGRRRDTWGSVPNGCSVQSGNDWAAHFGSNIVDPIASTMYSLVCMKATPQPTAPVTPTPTQATPQPTAPATPTPTQADYCTSEYSSALNDLGKPARTGATKETMYSLIVLRASPSAAGPHVSRFGLVGQLRTFSRGLVERHAACTIQGTH